MLSGTARVFGQSARTLLRSQTPAANTLLRCVASSTIHSGKGGSSKGATSPTQGASSTSSARSRFVTNVAHRTNARADMAFPGGFTSIDPFDLVKQEINGLSASISELLDNDHPALDKVAKYFFGQTHQGKRFRPAIVLLMSRATSMVLTNDEMILPKQYRLAEIAELIHTASLLHDDVIDGSDTRRNQPTAHTSFGNKVAILGGDFLLAKASIYTARLRHVEVIELLSTVIEHLVEGEFMQSKTNAKDKLVDFDYYLKKTYLKTASLIANSSKAAVLLRADDHVLADQAFRYGKNLGIAFQLVDDVLDFTQNSDNMGKPTHADLKEGIATAPVLFAAQEYPEITDMVARKFKGPGDVERALELVAKVDGVAQTQALAESFAEQAAEAISSFPLSPARDGLITLTKDVVTRQR